MYTSICLGACMCTICVQVAQGSQKKASESLELQAPVSHPVGVGTEPISAAGAPLPPQSDLFM